jgi:hypothetical protein
MAMTVSQDQLEIIAAQTLKARGLAVADKGRSAWSTLTPAEQEAIRTAEEEKLRVAEELAKAEVEIADMMDPQPLGHDPRFNLKTAERMTAELILKIFDGQEPEGLEKLLSQTTTFQSSERSLDPLRIDLSEKMNRLADLLLISLAQMNAAQAAGDNFGTEAHAIAATRLITEVYLLAAMNLGSRSTLFSVESVLPPMLLLTIEGALFAMGYRPLIFAGTIFAVLGNQLQNSYRLNALGAEPTAAKVRFPRLLPRFVVNWQEQRMATTMTETFWNLAGLKLFRELTKSYAPEASESSKRFAAALRKNQPPNMDLNNQSGVIQWVQNFIQNVSGQTIHSVAPSASTCEKFLTYQQKKTG